MVFKRGEILGYSIDFIMSVDGMKTLLIYFMPLGRVILEFFLCLLTMIIGN